ncbi:thioredoxin family protein [Gammaproteobacteria bacterium]|jgi:thiol-disulfide isomerase/thioredoxin|nr:thioredoxin family protein [Gammaproteobacteria bacterium]MDB4059579.1 thioredoxin family protein [Gammaproteobacteria bacterium]MDB9861411.1 thioredoxin family protein [Gammaproteobacteria bacterium]MDC1190868.1 thioredoxin family protein [Gammaproteobacteria bacterium]MDC1491687.1 thioredoxin family protein [Gammaproteobacteria bacterium]
MNKYLIFFLTILISMQAYSEFEQLTPNDILIPPMPLPYDEQVVSSEELFEFIKNTIITGKQPVIIFGGNWCPDCRILEGTLELATVKSFINKNYQIKHIDIGRYDRNMDLMNFLNIENRKGVPRVVILDLDKEILNSSTSSEWTTARDRKQQEIFDYFQKFVVKN